jgi:O-antigen/teichoic acid export membrane protein
MTAAPTSSPSANAVAVEEGPADKGEFRGPVMRGLAWQLGGRGTLQLTQVLVVVLLAHLLTPRQYGIAGMVLVVLSFEPVLAGVGFTAGLVQRKVITEEDISTAFWTNTAVGVAVCITGIAVSPLVADFYGNAQVRPLFAAASVVFLLSSLSSVQGQLLVREMNFRSLEIRALAAGLIGAIAAVVTAAEGGGAWALIVQQLAFYSVSLVLLWTFSKWHPRLLYSLDSLRELRRFGGNVSGTMMMGQLTQNADNVLVGGFLGASALGLYSFGYSLIMLPFSRITAPLFQVLYPVFSRVQHDRPRLLSLWLRSLRLMSVVMMPAMLGFIVVAPDLVDVVFGRRWHGATPVIQILSLVGLAVALQGLNTVVLQALDKTRELFRYSCILFGASLISFIVGLHWGIVGVATCFAAVNVFLQPLYLNLTARSMGIRPREWARALSGVMQATAVAIAAALLTRGLLLADGVPAPVRLAATIAVAAMLYGGALFWRAPEVVLEIRQLRPRRATAPAGIAAV